MYFEALRDALMSNGKSQKLLRIIIFQDDQIK